MTTFQNPTPLSDEDRFDIWFQAKWDQFSADVDRRYGVLPPAESTARKLAILGVHADLEKLRAIHQARIEREIEDRYPPEEIERRLAELKASIARAERDSNPHSSEVEAPGSVH